jgi:senataxin
VETLIPFLHGARRCVLVGDPQQLPSTVLSTAAQGVSFQRSLFERFTSLGAEAVLLSVQYRMHPEIRAFPSRAFYEGRLRDSESVIAAPPESYHASWPLRPYVLFDASQGKEKRSTVGSVSNPYEALIVVSLVRRLERTLWRKNGETVDGRCAIITPYKAQRSKIRDAFARVYGDESAMHRLGIVVSTVDGFQGQEADVIIFSTVRGGAGRGGIGFLQDVKRMNVALTRARRSLWIVGRVDALEGNPMWKDLVDDARERGCVVPDSELGDVLEVAGEDYDGGGGGGGGGGGARGEWIGGDRGVDAPRASATAYALPPPPH